MSVVTPKGGAARSPQQTSVESKLRKVRCLCGKWWAYRNGDALILRCKLCRRDIVIRGENLAIEYR